MAESSHNNDRLARLEERVKCFVCSGSFRHPRSLSCHHTFCKACLRCSVINNNNSVTCPECQAVHNLSGDGLEGLPSNPRIIHLLKVIKALERLAIWERQRDSDPHYSTPDIAMVTPSRTGSQERHKDIAMVTPSRTDSDDRHGDIAMVTPSMPGYAERRGTVFIDCDALLGGEPLCIAVSPAADRLYVTVPDHHTVQIFNDRGKLIITAYGPDVGPGASPRGVVTGFSCPTGIAVNKDGDVIVSDSLNHRAVVLDRDGEYKFSFGTHGKNDGQFDRPCDVAVDAACKIYVCDEGNHRVQVFSDGKYLRTFEKPANVSGEFCPAYLAIARTTGRVYVTDCFNHSVYVYTPLGWCITCFGTKGDGEGEMYNPAGICVDDDGRVLIADYGNHRVQVFNGNSTYLCTLGTAHDTPRLSWPDDLTMDKNGRVFVVDYGNKRVLVF